MKVIVAGDYSPIKRIPERFDDDINNLISSSDFAIVNFETCIKTSNSKPIEKQGPNLCTTQSSIEPLKASGFNVVTLANNHFYDYGDEAVDETIRTLDTNSIAHVGGGHNIQEAEKTLFLENNGKKLAIINCCEHEFSIATMKTAGSNPLNPIKQYYAIQDARKSADFVLVIVHGGIEHFQYPTLRMKNLYRFFIDAGADAVINHHQHCYSGYEYYNNKPICYGLGNFYFDMEYPLTSWHEGALAEIDFCDNNIKLTLHPYQQCISDQSVALLKGNDETTFRKNIDKINEIIKNDDQLDLKINEFYSSSRKYYKVSFSPYSNIYLQALCKRGLLPSFLSKKKILCLINYLLCESHYERLVDALTIRK